MRRIPSTTWILLAAAMLSGCREKPAPASLGPAAQTPASRKAAEVDLAVLRYDTGDVKSWPDYQFPLEHSFDLPAVPPEIMGPFTADDIPAE